MKHSTRSMLRTAIILFAAGLILTISCYIYAAANDIDVYGTSSVKAQYVSYREEISEVLSRSPEASKNLYDDENYPYFTSIEASSQVGNIEIVATEGETYIEYHDVDVNNLHCLITGDTLVIKEMHPVSFMGISVKNDGIAFDGLRQIFNKNSSVDSDRKITIHLNSSIQYDTLTVNANIGDIRIDIQHFFTNDFNAGNTCYRHDSDDYKSNPGSLQKYCKKR